MKCKNFFRGLALCLTLLVVNTFAQDCVAIAHVIYDGNNLFYADNEANFKYKQLSKEDDGTFKVCFTQERLEGSDRQGREDVRQLRFGSFCAEGKDTCASYLNEGHEPFLAELFPEYKNGVDSQQVFQVWLQINPDGTLTKSTTKPVIVEPAKKTIRFLAPWSNTGVVIMLNGKADYTTPVGSPYCGWFEYRAVLTPKDAYVSFKQTIGDLHIGAEGASKEEIPVEQEIRLDSLLQISDTVWIVGSKYSEPELYTEFPGELGDCPIKKLPVMMFDWLHGDGSDEENTKAQAGTTSQDFGTGGCKNDNGHQVMRNMVERELGPNGVPVPAANFPSNCKVTEHLGNWFLPEVVATDAAGNSYTNATCRDLELSLTDDGFWFGQKNTESPERGLFFLDDFQFLDSAGTVPNPMYDNISSDYGTHNYGFTMKIQATFEYVPGQYFEFLGDDDVWVFINNKLVVDIGGQHTQIEGKVKLDTIGKNNPADKLIPGETYPFHIFYAERHRNESNFKMRTSMDLKAEASMFLTDLSDDPKLIVKEVWQIVRETVLACDFSTSPEKQHTERGSSNFTLYGKSLDKNGVALKTLDSAYYSGITVTNDFTMITIDTKAITKAQALPPGNYYVRVRLKTNPDDYKDIPFTIEPYELPNIAFANVKDSIYSIVDFDTQDTLNFTEYWSPFGDELSRSISSDTLPINLSRDKSEKLWAGQSYPVSIMYAEEWAIIYNGIAVNIKTSTPNLIVCDAMGNPINQVLLMGGRARFFVKATDEVVDGVLTISTEGSKNKEIQWTKINIAVPPVPQIENAYIYDRTGDGRADSIWIKLTKPIDARTSIDSIKFLFQEDYEEYKATKVAYKVDNYNIGDISISITAPGTGFESNIFTGGKTSPYAGLINIWYTYIDEDNKIAHFPVDGSLTDMVGPVITAAEVKYLKDGNTQVTLTFSEGIDGTDAHTELFRFHCWKNNVQDSIIKSASDILTSPEDQWKLIFPKGLDTDIVPAVGDSVRFMPPSQLGMALDLVGVGPHEMNPWIRITGEQKVTVTSPKVVSLSTESETFDSARVIIQSPEATVPKLVSAETSMSADQVAAQYGTQGHYLGDLDMAELVENEIAEIVKAVQNKSDGYKRKEDVELEEETGVPAKSYSLKEIIAAVDAGTMTINEAKKQYGLSEVIVDAYKNNLLNSENLGNYERGTKADVQKIVSAVADKTELRYEAIYYSSLGHYVNSHSGTITCNDDIFKEGGKQNCLENGGRLFLAWNMRSDNGRLAATGVYIARLIFRVKVNTKVIVNRTQDFLWGVRRGQVNAIDFGL